MYQPVGDPVIDMLNILAEPPAYGMGRDRYAAAEEARLQREHEAEMAALRRRTDMVVQEKLRQSYNNGRNYELEFSRAAHSVAMGHELSYRAWRFVAEALVKAANGGGGRLEASVGPDASASSAIAPTPLGTVDSVVKNPRARASLTVENVQQLAAVEEWRQLARALMGEYTPAAGDEDKVSYFRVSSVRQDGTGAEPVSDLVGDFERRRPGMLAGIVSSGVDALRELQRAGLAPSDMDLRLGAAEDVLREAQEGKLNDLRAAQEKARSYRASIEDGLNAAKARLAQMSRDPGKPPLFGRAKWDEANQQRLRDLAAAQQEKAGLEAKLSALDGNLRDSGVAVERMERDLRLGVPGIMAIAVAAEIPLRGDVGAGQLVH
ncbi:MAG: hypothetical protein HKL99_14050 [Burkholderiales bacterium]|nr:hypothetical protein [Burkholderiales bacterium]